MQIIVSTDDTSENHSIDIKTIETNIKSTANDEDDDDVNASINDLAKLHAELIDKTIKLRRIASVLENVGQFGQKIIPSIVGDSNAVTDESFVENAKTFINEKQKLLHVIKDTVNLNS